MQKHIVNIEKIEHFGVNTLSNDEMLQINGGSPYSVGYLFGCIARWLLDYLYNR